MKPIEFTATVSKDAPPALMNALGQMAVHAAAMQIPTEPTMNDTPTPQTGESPSDSLVSFTMNHFANRIATLETDLATALRERDEARDGHRKQTENYIRLCDAVMGDGARTSDFHDPVEIAKATRTELAEARKDSERLETIEKACWGVYPVSEPMAGGDDADIGWRVVEYHMSKPREREIGYGRTPRAAIDAAAQPKKQP